MLKLVETPTKVESSNQTEPITIPNSKARVMKLIEKFLEECDEGPHPSLTVEKIFTHLPKIVLAIEWMRQHYSKPVFFERENDAGPYYQKCWERLDSAKTMKEYIAALRYLKSSIEYE